MLKELIDKYLNIDCQDLGARQLIDLRNGIKEVKPEEITSSDEGKAFIDLLRKFREAVAENDKLHGENYPKLLNSILSVGEDGLYSNSLRFIFELIQNVDDCDYHNPDDCKLDMRFDFNSGEIILTYNEVGFSPFNVFAITGIAEAAKNVSATKNEIGEKGIGFKSVFGVASRVLIRSGWFSFELRKENFTIPIASYLSKDYLSGTQMTLYVDERAEKVYKQIRDQYCRKEALFSKNPLIFLNKLTSLKLYFDCWRSMEFKVSRKNIDSRKGISREDNIKISVNLRDHDNGTDRETVEEITGTRYTYLVNYSQKACQSRYGDKTLVGSNGGKSMLLQAIVPSPEDVEKVGNGGLYSFLPTQLSFTVPVVCHAPFKLDASREFVDPQEENLWFNETSIFLSELIEYVYKDWSSVCENNILYYLPAKREGVFAKNNGKELCLSKQSRFKGEKFLKLPIFKTINGIYKPYNEIYCFNSEEQIQNASHVADMLGLSKFLFIPPDGLPVTKFEIKTERNIYNRLFIEALLNKRVTIEALDYLDKAGCEFTEKQIPRGLEFRLDTSQIECIMSYKRLSEIMLKTANAAIKDNSRPKFSVDGMNLSSIYDVLYEDFELSETPKDVEKYINYCKGGCVCLNIADDCFLPCRNCIVLSKSNPLASFAAFCYEIDKSDTFAIRIKLREASSKLNECVESNSGSAEDYIRDLRNIRLTVRDSLGMNGYKSYIDLILKSGTNRTRFIQELLQNADDCEYLSDTIPTFSLYQRDGLIVTEYNEKGFNRSNIRSITAIGESTKNRLLSSDYRSIGEKGVGFKTVFSVASEVKISSGEFNFSLSDRMPTIPKLINSQNLPVDGTRMEFVLKDRSVIPSLKPADILELCMCLRKLRNLDINGHKVTIVDSETQREISIDNHTYKFSKYLHPFYVTDKKALSDRENGSRYISPHQKIICYVPEKTVAKDYPLYSGLPTKHRIRIPLIIDAPFELTTSREEIEVDCKSWNDIILKEIYNAIVSVIQTRKKDDRAYVFRFARFTHRLLGNHGSVYVNDLSDSPYLNSYDFLSRLRSESIVPTFNKDIFVSLSQKTSYRYPEAAIWLLHTIPYEDNDILSPETVIDSNLPEVSKEQKDRIEAVFNALVCEDAPFLKVFSIILKYAENYITDDEFRNYLYNYLIDIPDEYRYKLLDLEIIPVYDKKGGYQFISWQQDSIFVKKDTRISDNSYWILNEKLLPKSNCEKIFQVNINEMDFNWERSRYQSGIQEIIRGNDLPVIYNFLINEFNSGKLQKNESLGVLLEYKDVIPLKNELGDITVSELFLCDQPTGYFDVDLLKSITVHSECSRLAEYIKCRNLSDIYYDDLIYFEQLTADDIEALQDDYFAHSEEILRGFYRDDCLSDELIQEYELEYLAMGRTNDTYYSEYQFPQKPVKNKQQLISHINTILNNPVEIFTVKVERSVLKGRRSNGATFDLNSNEARNNTLQIYTPNDANKIAFCQMCCKPKPYMLMEVNNLESKPKYYFHQTRVALCLECSKRFEALREKEVIRKEYLNAIRNANITTEGIIEIPFGSEDKLTFTATHLAEIQELLKRNTNNVK